MPARGERLLAAELIGTEVIITARQLAKKQVPTPRHYFAALLAFAGLSGLALIGDDQADFAAALGGLVLLSAAISFPEFFTWAAQAAGGPGFGPSTATTTKPKAPPKFSIIGSVPITGRPICNTFPILKKVPYLCG